MILCRCAARIYRSLTRGSTYKLHVLLFFIAHKTFLFLLFYFLFQSRNVTKLIFGHFFLRQISLHFDDNDVSYRITKEVKRLKYDLFTFNFNIHI